MRRLGASIKGDLLLQFRYGFYTVYIVVTLFYIILLQQLPKDFLPRLTPLIVFSDPSILGFYFIGGLILLEKDENTLDALIVTPLQINEYLISKLISLTMLAVVASLSVALFGYGRGFDYLLLIIGIVLTSLLFIVIGFIAVVRFDNLNEYLFSSIIYIFVLNLPLLDFFGLYDNWLFYLLPTQASLILIGGAFTNLKLWQLSYGIVYLILWIMISYPIAYQSFYRFVVLKEKEGDR